MVADARHDEHGEKDRNNADDDDEEDNVDAVWIARVISELLRP